LLRFGAGGASAKIFDSDFCQLSAANDYLLNSANQAVNGQL
jgi:hypothetical protein